MATILQIGLENALAATILATVVAALAPLLKRRPALRHCLYLVVLLKLVTPPLWRVPIIPTNESTHVVVTEPREIPVPEADLYLSALHVNVLDNVIFTGDESPEIAEVSFDPPITVQPASPPFPLPPMPWVDLLGAAWVGGSLICLILTLDRIHRFRSVLGQVKPAPESVEDLVSEVVERLDLGRRPRVGIVAGEISPMVWSLGFRPFLLLPGELWGRLDNRQRTTLLAHEMAHVKRGDDWVRLFELTVTILFWWLPIVWRVRSTLRDAEEQCCDAWVVWAYPEASKAYAETLVETVDFLSGDRSPVPAFASGIGRVQHLKRRLSMIMKGTTPRTLGFGGTLAALTLSALLLPMSPTLAQNPDEKKDEGKVVVIVRDQKDENDSADLIENKIIDVFDVDGNVKVTSADDAKVENVQIIVKGDKPSATSNEKALTYTLKVNGKEGAISEAVKKLQDSIKELQDKEKKSAEDQAMIKVLKQAIDSLTTKNASWTTKPDTATTLFRGADSRPLTLTRAARNFTLDSGSPEQKADQDQLVAQMKKLQAEAQQSQAQMRQAQQTLVKTHKQLAEIAAQLARLQRSAGGEFQINFSEKINAELQNNLRNLNILNPPPPVPPVAPVPPAAPLLLTPPVAPVQPVPPDAPTPRVQVDRQNRILRPLQDRRIDDLEKKLDQILNRLESKDKKDAEATRR